MEHDSGDPFDPRSPRSLRRDQRDTERLLPNDHAKPVNRHGAVPELRSDRRAAVHLLLRMWFSGSSMTDGNLCWQRSLLCWWGWPSSC